jgi:carbonic anhydrase
MIRLAREHVEELAAPDLDSRPRRKVAVLACMDTRLDIFPMLGIDRGDAHIIRNAGGLVTDDAMRSLTVSQRLLGTEEIIVLMHDGCGLLGASDQDFADALAADGASPAWRLGAFDDVDRALSQGLALLRQAPTLPHRDAITGFVFTPQTGALREVGARDEVAASGS